MVEDKFRKYQSVKEDISFFYKGYPLHDIISVEIARVIFGLKKFTLKTMFTFILSRRIVIPALNENEVLYSMGDYKRNDYYSLLNYVREQIPGTVVDFNESRRKIKINPYTIFLALKQIYRMARTLSLKERLILSASYAYIMNCIDDIEKNEVKSGGAYISFCSSHIHEGMLDIFFQRKGIPTFTLQHGLYFIFKNTTIDAICYENVISDKLLCWGGYTKDEFIRYGVPEEKLVIAGYPGVFKRLGKKNPTEKLKVLILLSRYVFHENNIRILDIVSSINKKNANIHVDVKMHPSLKFSDYQVYFEQYGFSLCKEGTIKSLLENDGYDITISYNSTAYYDSYMNNCVSLRYVDGDADGSIEVLDDGFFDESSLSEKLALFSSEMCTQVFWDDVEKRLEYISGFNINNYAAEIRNVLQSENRH